MVDYYLNQVFICFPTAHTKCKLGFCYLFISHQRITKRKLVYYYKFIFHQRITKCKLTVWMKIFLCFLIFFYVWQCSRPQWCELLALSCACKTDVVVNVPPLGVTMLYSVCLHFPSAHHDDETCHCLCFFARNRQRYEEETAWAMRWDPWSSRKMFRLQR